MILDLFAGPGGWSEGLRSIGLSDVGMEWDRDACRTRAAAGHLTVRADVAAYPCEPFAGRVEGLIASPPCQAFSMAGNRLGILDLGRIHAAVEGARGGWRDELRAGEWADPRSALILEPLRWTWALRPTWVACEQVPPALAVWEHMADVLRSWGYDAAAVRLLAADYGVPQTRLRAFLLAHRERVRIAQPTHAKLPVPELFGPALLPWVSMASALQREVWEKPAPTIVGTRRSKDGILAGRQLPPGEGVNVGGWDWKLRAGTNEHDVARGPDEPAPTLRFGARMNDVSWIQNDRRGIRGDARRNATVRSVDEPAPSILASADNGDMKWLADSGAVRITLEEAAVLQSFPADYPFQGTKTARFRQVGDAVPPRLAAHVIRELRAAA